MDFMLLANTPTLLQRIHVVLQPKRLDWLNTREDFLNTPPEIYRAILFQPGVPNLTLAEVIVHAENTPVIVVGRDDDTEQEIVQVIKAGACDYVHPQRLNRLTTSLLQLPTTSEDAEDSYTGKQFQALFEDSIDVILIVDKQHGHILLANPTVELVLGHKPAQLQHQPFTVLLPQESHLSTRYIIRELNAYGTVFETQSFLHGDGTIIPMDLTATYTTWQQQQALLLVLRDVTAREVVQEALQQSEERLRLVVNRMDIILFVLDKEGRFTLLEGKAVQKIGLSPLEVLGRHILDVFQHLNDPLEHIHFALQGHTIHGLRHYADRIFEVLYTPIFTPHGDPNGMIALAIDVTDREHMREEKLRAEQSRREVEEERKLLRFREDFISMVSHEFRTPLTVIQSSTQILKRSKNKLPEERQDTHLGKILDHTLYMNKLLEDVMLISKARSGHLKFEPQRLDLKALFYDIIQAMDLHEQTTHEATYVISENLSDVLMDMQLLRYILNNLISNAFKYTPQGGSISISILRDHLYVFFTIKDSGIGIPIHDQKMLFEPFHRAHNVGKIKGTGLGLALVKMAVDAHGGSISFESELGLGTSFYVQLPCS